MKIVNNITFSDENERDNIENAFAISLKAMHELQDMIESVEAYDGREALEMLDRVYGFVRSYTRRPSIAERRPELVGKIVGGGNLKEGIE